MSGETRPYDIVVFGATGFTGRQAARDLHQHAPADLRLAIAGRNRAKLEQLASELGSSKRGPVGILVADSNDPETITTMCQSTRVLCTTAGPFVRYGSAVVAACVKAKTDYCDITGETVWARDMIDRYQVEALANGTRLVPFSGYDSCPSDLGTLLLAEAAAKRGEQLSRVDAFHSGRGGWNGGTLATVVEMAKAGRERELSDPFLLCPGFRPTEPQLRASHDPEQVVYHAAAGRYATPFFMSQINTRVVRRTAWLLAQSGAPAYARDFVYQEYTGTKRRWPAEVMRAGMEFSLAAMRYPLLRDLFVRFARQPGEGPSEKQMDEGHFRSRFYGVTSGGQLLKAELSGRGDPANRTTVCFLAESALALACDRDRLPARAGFLTPATAFGSRLIERVRERGMRAEVLAD